MYTAAILIKNKKILLLKRSRHEDQPFKWSPPNETIEKGETPQNAITRGVKEETNLNFKISKRLEDHYYYNKKTTIFLGKTTGKFILNKHENSKAEWFSYEKVLKLNFAFGYKKVVIKLHKLDLI